MEIMKDMIESCKQMHPNDESVVVDHHMCKECWHATLRYLFLEGNVRQGKWVDGELVEDEDYDYGEIKA